MPLAAGRKNTTSGRRMMLACLILWTLCNPCAAVADEGPQPTALTPALREQALGMLRDAMAHGERWDKVHAAERLLVLGYTDEVRAAFEREVTDHGGEPKYRIGVWRVLARAAVGDDERATWTAKIRGALFEPGSQDALHALETLAKLGYALEGEERTRLDSVVESCGGTSEAYASWLLANQGDLGARDRLAKMLNAEDASIRRVAAYALRQTPAITDASRAELMLAAQHEGAGQAPSVFFVSAAYVRAPEDLDTKDLEGALLAYLRQGTPGERYEAAEALAARAAPAELPLLLPLLDDPDPDVRTNAAYVVLRIERRIPHSLVFLDWLVIACYAAGMLSIGWYYARRTSGTEDYLLGGRNMHPFTVGLSMFATLLSTITYLAVPGEMIRHGPMITAQYVVYPLIFIVIGFVLIPFIMRLKVTTAYEILERRLGVSVRLLGATLFLALRLMWMAVIIYATSSKVLVPLLGWDQSATPIVCAVLGLITLAYTSTGGLRAVVMTDAIQTGILFGGAILTLSLITVKMGGVGAWWPTAWAAHWDPVRFGLDPTARVTMLGAVISVLIWYVCTSGSDQVAVQRYLATRDAASARRVLLVSLVTGVATGVFLAVLGLALFGYFSASPHLLPDGQQVYTNADVLFPRFIVMGLPAGVSGLVVAGLLAAAMSSLSSGMNSGCSVITVDFIQRFRRPAGSDSENAKLRTAKLTSIALGLSVILLSVGVGQVSGNLLEIAYKVVNLLTAPLFVLFFMAMFVPWATTPGTWLAGMCSITAAVGIAYGHWFGLSFLWILPLSLLAGVIVGPIASLVPLGSRVRPWEAAGKQADLDKEPASGSE